MGYAVFANYSVPSAQKTDFAVQVIKPRIEIAISLGNAIGEKMPQIKIITVSPQSGQSRSLRPAVSATAMRIMLVISALTKTHTGICHGGLG